MFFKHQNHSSSLKAFLPEGEFGIHVFAMAGRVDPLLDHAGALLAAIGDVLGASAARGTVRHEAVVIEIVAPRHIRSVLAGQRSEGTRPCATD